MTLEQLGNLGELIGSLGVIVSLVYLADKFSSRMSSRGQQFGIR